MLEWFPDFVKSLGILAFLAVGFIFTRPEPDGARIPLARQIVIGLVFGVVIAVVLIDPIRLPQGATFDPRAGPAILAGVLGGPVAGVIAAACGAAVRYGVVAGPVALGGAVSFVLYGSLGIAAGVLLRRWNRDLTPLTLLGLGLLGTLVAVPAFFVSVDPATGLEILNAAWPILLANNVAGTLVVGVVLNHLRATERLRAHVRDRRAEDATLSLVARYATNVVLITDAKGRTEWANDAFERVTGYTVDEARGREPGALLQGPDSDPETIALMSERVRAHKGFDVDIVNYTKDGRAYWVRILCEPVEAPDEPLRFIAVEEDITTRKHAELQLAESRAQLENQLLQTMEAQARVEEQAAQLAELAESENDLRVKAEAAEKAKGEFLASMSHEIRTPMTGILGLSDMLLDDKALDSATVHKVQRIKAAAQSLIEIINDILDISKVEAGKIELDLSEFETRDLADEVVHLLEGRAKEKGVAVEIVVEDGAPRAVIADRTRLRQILWNLLGNALKFTSEGRVTVTLSGDTETLRIDVEDTGIGIKADVLPKLFSEFTQADASISRRFQGTGLGLAICKRLVELMDGVIGVESTFGEGSRFWFRIPLRESGPCARAKKTAAAPRALRALRPLDLLVAEDSELNRMVIGAILDKHGHRHVFAENGHEAVAAAQERAFDAILMDVRMPEMDGIEATRAIRAGGGPAAAAPIVALTADAMAETLQECLDAGMNAACAKPIDQTHLFQTLNDVLGETIHVPTGAAQ
jgi:PAS domain S-box-containing protein